MTGCWSIQQTFCGMRVRRRTVLGGLINEFELQRRGHRVTGAEPTPTVQNSPSANVHAPGRQAARRWSPPDKEARSAQRRSPSPCGKPCRGSTWQRSDDADNDREDDSPVVAAGPRSCSTNVLPCSPPSSRRTSYQNSASSSAIVLSVNEPVGASPRPAGRGHPDPTGALIGSNPPATAGGPR